MIIVTQDRLTVGKRYHDVGTLTDGNKVKHKVSFLVIRKANEMEYLDYCKSVDATPGPIDWNDRYYEISTD